MKYAYLRVSTESQHLDRQIAAIKTYAKDTISPENYFSDKASGKDFERQEYQRLKSVLQSGDELIIQELDRLGRNKDAIKEEIRWFSDNHIILRILDLPTSLMETPKGQEWILEMVNNILVEVLAAVAQQERAKILGRQKAGIAAAKARGVYSGTNRKGGKKRKECDKAIFEQMYQLHTQGKIPLATAAQALDLCISGASRRFKERREMGEGYDPNVRPTKSEAAN